MNRSGGLEESMRVLVRVRPPENDLESSSSPPPSLVVDETEKKLSISRDKNKGTAEFSFSHVLNSSSTQQDLFHLCKDLIIDVTDGINCAILAYGQTGSGKTYSMLGQGWEDISPNENQDDRVIQEHEKFGLIPRCVAELFEWIKKQSSDESFDYSINCQYIQIYNEKIFDLLQDRKRENPLQIRDADRGSNCSVYVQGLSQYLVHSLDDVLQLLVDGMKNRAIRATELNNESSRSHTILQLYIQFHGQDSSGFSTLTRSTLSFVDLAGSEKWRPSLTTTSSTQSDQQIREMTNINTSLHVLGNCVSALIESGRKHIPFRDSILTRLLQDSLGGGKTTLIATVRSDEIMKDETYSTLQFASRASKIKTILRPLTRPFANLGNTTQGEGGLTLEQAKKEIAMLRARVQSLESQSQLKQQAEVGESHRILVVPSMRHCGITEEGIDSNDIEISINENCLSCEALEKVLLRYLSIIQVTSNQSDEESANWGGYSSTEDDNLRDIMEQEDVKDGDDEEEEKENQRSHRVQFTENSQKFRQTPAKVRKEQTNTAASTAAQAYGSSSHNASMKKKKIKKKKLSSQVKEVENNKKSETRNQQTIPSPIQTTPNVTSTQSSQTSQTSQKSTDSLRIQESFPTQKIEMKSFLVDNSPVVHSPTSPVMLKSQSVPISSLTYTGTTTTRPTQFTNHLSHHDSTSGGMSNSQKVIDSVRPNLTQQNPSPTPLVSYYSQSSSLPSASTAAHQLHQLQQQSQQQQQQQQQQYLQQPQQQQQPSPPLQNNSLSTSCQKHGLQSCVLCSMFTTPMVSQNKPIQPISASVNPSSSLPSTNYFPSTQPAMTPLQRSFPSTNSGVSSSILCPVHFVTNCLLCTLTKSNQPFSYSINNSNSNTTTTTFNNNNNNGSNLSIGSPSSLQFASTHANSLLAPHPSFTSPPIQNNPVQSFPTSSSATQLPLSTFRSSTLNTDPNSTSSTSNIRNDWERILQTTGFNSSSLSSQKSSLLPSHHPTLQPLNQIPNLSSSSSLFHNQSVSNSLEIHPTPSMMSSLSSAESAFGFTTIPPSQKSPKPVVSSSSRPPSHHQPLRTPPIQQSHATSSSSSSSLPTSIDFSPTSNTPKSLIPSPYQHLKKGIVFEDENDDTGPYGGRGGAHKRMNHQRNSYHALHSNQEQEKDVEEEAEMQMKLKTHSHRSNHADTQSGNNNSPTGKKKQSKENKKLMKLPNGALVKKR